MARPGRNNPEGKQKQQGYEKANEEGKLQKFFEALKGGLSRSSAIVFAGLPRRTVYDRIQKDETFAQKVEDAEEYRVGVVEGKKKEKIDEGYRPAIEKELETSKFERYGKREKKDITLEGGVDFRNLSDEELLKIIKGG